MNWKARWFWSAVSLPGLHWPNSSRPPSWYRRLLLRDPELPDVLLPAEWPGQKARLLCKELYGRLAPASERHLERCLVLADGTIPSDDPDFADRFL
jgi:DNA-binding transcriptional regulator PaaX